MAIVVELPPRAEGEVVPVEGHTMETRDCFSCWRDFRVYVPQGERYGTTVTHGVPCPHCHRYEAEVIVGSFSAPILVEATRRTWGEWQKRRLSRLWQNMERYVFRAMSGVRRRATWRRKARARAERVRTKRERHRH